MSSKTLSSDTAYRSFGGEVEARTPPRYAAFPDSRPHQLSAIALAAVPNSVAKCHSTAPKAKRRDHCSVSLHHEKCGRKATLIKDPSTLRSQNSWPIS